MSSKSTAAMAGTSTDIHSEYQNGRERIGVGYTGSKAPGGSTSFAETALECFGPTVDVISTYSNDLDAKHELAHTTTGLKYSLRGRARVIEQSVGRRLASFQDPIKAVLPVTVVDAHRVIVTTKEVVGGRSIIAPERAPARTVGIKETSREVVLERYGGDLEMNLNLQHTPGAFKEELDLKIEAQQKELERVLIELGYETLMTQGLQLPDAIQRSNPIYGEGMSEADRCEVRLEANRIYIQNCFAALTKNPFPLQSILSAAKYATAYSIGAPGSILILPHGVPEMLRYTKPERMKFNISGLKTTDNKPISMDLGDAHTDPATNIRMMVHIPMPTYEYGTAMPRVGMGCLSRVVTVVSFYIVPSRISQCNKSDAGHRHYGMLGRGTIDSVEPTGSDMSTAEIMFRESFRGTNNYNPSHAGALYACGAADTAPVKAEKIERMATSTALVRTRFTEIVGDPQSAHCLFKLNDDNIQTARELFGAGGAYTSSVSGAAHQAGPWNTNATNGRIEDVCKNLISPFTIPALLPNNMKPRYLRADGDAENTDDSYLRRRNFSLRQLFFKTTPTAEGSGGSSAIGYIREGIDDLYNQASTGTGKFVAISDREEYAKLPAADRAKVPWMTTATMPCVTQDEMIEKESGALIKQAYVDDFLTSKQADCPYTIQYLKDAIMDHEYLRPPTATIQMRRIVGVKNMDLLDPEKIENNDYNQSSNVSPYTSAADETALKFAPYKVTKSGNAQGFTATTTIPSAKLAPQVKSRLVAAQQKQRDAAESSFTRKDLAADAINPYSDAYYDASVKQKQLSNGFLFLKKTNNTSAAAYKATGIPAAEVDDYASHKYSPSAKPIAKDVDRYTEVVNAKTRHTDRVYSNNGSAQLVFRKTQVLMSSAILASPGVETGELLVGMPHTGVSTSQTDESLKMQLRVYLGAVLKQPESAIILPDVAAEGVVHQTTYPSRAHQKYKMSDGKGGCPWKKYGSPEAFVEWMENPEAPNDFIMAPESILDMSPRICKDPETGTALPADTIDPASAQVSALLRGVTGINLDHIMFNQHIQAVMDADGKRPDQTLEKGEDPYAYLSKIASIVHDPDKAGGELGTAASTAKAVVSSVQMSPNSNDVLNPPMDAALLFGLPIKGARDSDITIDNSAPFISTVCRTKPEEGNDLCWTSRSANKTLKGASNSDHEHTYGKETPVMTLSGVNESTQIDDSTPVEQMSLMRMFTEKIGSLTYMGQPIFRCSQKVVLSPQDGFAETEQILENNGHFGALDDVANPSKIVGLCGSFSYNHGSAAV